MKITTESLVSITDANRNFSKVAHLVDKNGIAVVLKNNVPRYTILKFDQIQHYENAQNEEIGEIVKRVFQNDPA